MLQLKKDLKQNNGELKKLRDTADTYEDDVFSKQEENDINKIAQMYHSAKSPKASTFSKMSQKHISKKQTIFSQEPTNLKQQYSLRPQRYQKKPVFQTEALQNTMEFCNQIRDNLRDFYSNNHLGTIQ